MKKSLLIISALYLVTSNGFAQLDSIPNTNFDYWTSGEPNGWGTSNGLSLGGTSLSGSVTKASGADILSVNTIVLSSQHFPCGGSTCIAPGMAISNGTIVILGGGLAAGGGIAFAGGFPYRERAIALTGMYKYICVGDGSNGSGGNINVILTKWNGASRDTLAIEQLLLPTNTSYAAFSVPITYSITAVAPDSAQIILLSSGHYVPAQLFVDNLAFDNPTGIVSEAELRNGIVIYPNPATTRVSITLPEIVGITNLTIVNVLGETVYGQIITSKTTSINIENFAKGIYTIVVNVSGNRIFKKLVVN